MKLRFQSPKGVQAATLVNAYNYLENNVSITERCASCNILDMALRGLNSFQSPKGVQAATVLVRVCMHCRRFQSPKGVQAATPLRQIHLGFPLRFQSPKGVQAATFLRTKRQASGMFQSPKGVQAATVVAAHRVASVILFQSPKGVQAATRIASSTPPTKGGFNHRKVCKLQHAVYPPYTKVKFVSITERCASCNTYGDGNGKELYCVSITERCASCNGVIDPQTGFPYVSITERCASCNSKIKQNNHHSSLINY